MAVVFLFNTTIVQTKLQDCDAKLKVLTWQLKKCWKYTERILWNIQNV